MAETINLLAQATVSIHKPIKAHQDHQHQALVANQANHQAAIVEVQVNHSVVAQEIQVQDSNQAQAMVSNQAVQDSAVVQTLVLVHHQDNHTAEVDHQQVDLQVVADSLAEHQAEEMSFKDNHSQLI